MSPSKIMNIHSFFISQQIKIIFAIYALKISSFAVFLRSKLAAATEYTDCISAEG